jgi:hypothetical protein
MALSTRASLANPAIDNIDEDGRITLYRCNDSVSGQTHRINQSAQSKQGRSVVALASCPPWLGRIAGVYRPA